MLKLFHETIFSDYFLLSGASKKEQSVISIFADLIHKN